MNRRSITSWLLAGAFLVLFCWFGLVSFKFRAIFAGLEVEDSLPITTRLALAYGPIVFPLFAVVAALSLILLDLRRHRILGLSIAVLAILMAGIFFRTFLQPVWFVGSAHRVAEVTDGHTPEEQRQIAEACWSMLHSSLTNETEIQTDDSRVPEIIRSLQPIQIEIQGTDVVIMRSGKPAEYHLSCHPSDPKPWVLYVAGDGYQGHQELIRLDRE